MAQLGREHQRVGDARDLLAPRPGADRLPLRQEALLTLQRTAGNQAVSGLVQRMSEPADGPAPGGLAPAQDAAKEHQADSVADRTVDLMGGRGLPPRGGLAGLTPALGAALGPNRGALGNVEYDTSGAGPGQAEAMGARAFADGRRVSFAPGELDLSTRDGVHLAAHETAHAALHAPASGPGGAHLVHAKLRGTSEAAMQMGGGRSTKGIRKAFRLKTNWDKILDGLAAYETLEETLLAKGRPSNEALAIAKPKMLTALTKVEAALVAWQDSNDQTGEQAKVEEQRKIAINPTDYEDADEKTEHDIRTKASRRQTVAMLLPRVRTELADVGAGDWSRSLGLSDTQVRGKGHEESGQMGTASELHYETESGAFSGYFKEDTGHLPGGKAAGRDIESGIRLSDPNFGARAMAMYRLDQLLGAGVTARVEFAVHDGKLGVVTESAGGTKASKVNWTAGTGGTGSPSSDDAVLQRCLNKLQILDTIALQLDRHMGNYFVQTGEKGQVTGVTGIDLDMAFGGNYTDVGTVPKSWKSYSYRGLPKEIDEEFGNRILAVSDDQIRNALKGLLSEGEVEATVARFQFVRGKVQQAKEAGQLRQDWGPNTAKTSKPEEVEDLLDTTMGENYAEAVRANGLENTVKDLMEFANVALRSEVGDVPEPTMEVYQAAFVGDKGRKFFKDRGSLYTLVAKALAARTLKPEEGESAIEDLFQTVLSDSGLRAGLEVAVQEGTLNAKDTSLRALETRIVLLYNQEWPNVLRRRHKQLVKI